MEQSQNKLKLVGILAAGGSGTRLGLEGGKQLLEILGKPVAAWSLDSLARSASIDELIVVCDPSRVPEYTAALLPHLETEKGVSFIAGGESRQDSVFAGLLAAQELEADIVVIHDGARPLLKSAELDEAIQVFIDHQELEGLIFGHPVTDSLKRVRISDQKPVLIEQSLNRSEFYAVQTPQIFETKTLFEAHEQAQSQGILATDDAALVEALGRSVGIFEAARYNIKVTLPEDVLLVESSL